MTLLLEKAFAKASALPEAEQDALARRLLEEMEDAWPSAEKSLRQAWQEAQRGEVRPISELWDGIEDG